MVNKYTQEDLNILISMLDRKYRNTKTGVLYDSPQGDNFYESVYQFSGEKTNGLKITLTREIIEKIVLKGINFRANDYVLSEFLEDIQKVIKCNLNQVPLHINTEGLMVFSEWRLKIGK